MRLAGVIVQLIVDLALLMRLLLRPKRAVASENLFLRKQLAMYQERGVKPRRPSTADRISLAVLSRWFDWRDALVVVEPRTLIRWHRAGFRLFWRYKSRPGPPPIPQELQALIRRMAIENVSWGRSDSRTSCCSSSDCASHQGRCGNTCLAGHPETRAATSAGRRSFATMRKPSSPATFASR